MRESSVDPKSGPWDEIYSTGAHLDNWERGDAAPELVTFIESRAWPTTARAIDLGCGTGVDACYLAEHGFDVIGIDLSSVAIEQARARSERAAISVTWMTGDVCRLPIPDSSIDLALDGSCAHHFSPAEWGEFVAEMARVLVPGGTLLLRGVSDQHRPGNCLRESDIRSRFAGPAFSVVSVSSIELVGATRRAPGLQAIVERRHEGGSAHG